MSGITPGRILGLIGQPVPESGLAAMRMWGQTGDRPTVWISAADPVYLEPRLDHLCLHALRETDVSKPELRSLYDHLQDALSDESGYGFARLGSLGYLRSESPLATADVDAEAIDGQVPNDYLPSGETAASFRRLLSEIEMALHDHAVNIEREMQGKVPVNSLWIWGGGYAPERQVVPHPPLFADDPLLRGYWESVTGAFDTWPGTIDACLEASESGFVAVAKRDDGDLLERSLEALREALVHTRLSRLLLLFADGIFADVRAADRFRFWRGASQLLEEPAP